MWEDPNRLFDSRIFCTKWPNHGWESTIKGIDLVKLPESEMRKVRGKEIAMIFQDPSLSESST